MCTVRAGQPRAQADQRAAGDVAAVVVLDHDRRRSRRGASARALARRAVMVTPVGFWARGCRNTARHRPCAARQQPGDRHAVVVQVHADDLARRADRAGRAGAGTSGARPRRDRRGARTTWATRSSASIAPSTTVICLGLERPRSARSTSSSVGQHRLVEVAPRQRLPTDRGDTTGPRSGSSAGSGVPVDRSSAKCPGPSVTRR